MRLARLGQAVGAGVLAAVSVASVRGGMALGHIDAQERTAPLIYAASASAAPPAPGLHPVDPGGGQRRAGHRSKAFALRRMNWVSPG